MSTTKDAKMLIRAIKQTIIEKDGEGAASQAEVAKRVGVSHTSIKNWERGSVTVADENLARLEETLAELGGSLKLPPPKEIAPKHEKAKKTKKAKKAGFKAILGDLAPPAPSKPSGKKKAYGTPIWNNMKIPNLKAEEAKLAKFIASVGLKQFSPASPSLCDDGSVYWSFVAEFSPKAMGLIVKKLNEHNRQVGAERGKQYALDMVSDNWGWTGEPILFSRNGDLMNGQNRMLAGRACGRSLVFQVGFGLSPDAIRFMDRPMVRSNRHQGQAEGWSYNHSRAMTIGLLHRYEKSKDGSTDFLDKVAPGMLRIGGARHEELNKSYLAELDPALEFIHGLRWGIGRRALPKHIGVFMFMLMSRQSPEAARYFMLSLADATHAMPGSPIYALRYRLTKLVSDRVSEPARHKNLVRDQIGQSDTDAQVSRGTEAIIMRSVAGAWNSFCAGKKNSSGNFRSGHDGLTTTKIVGDLAKPCPKALKESMAFTAEALEAVLKRSQGIRAIEERKAFNKNRDEGDVKHSAIKKAIETN